MIVHVDVIVFVGGAHSPPYDVGVTILWKKPLETVSIPALSIQVELYPSICAGVT